ncbi:MAG: CehA/McbA family metallohydrolase [Deltaproteobacteria bacterium]|nr:CehA/McbA family metallohydrolase [Deltaproteobacteria bacterium]
MDSPDLAERRRLGPRGSGFPRLALALLWLSAFGCDDAWLPTQIGSHTPALVEESARLGPGFSLDAKIDTHEMLVEDIHAPRHASDGGGRAWLVDGDPRPAFRAGSAARFEIVYQAGPLGIAEGGALYLQAPPFWDWDPPQVRFADAPGYTEVSTEAEGVELLLDDFSGEILVILIGGRGLVAGERIHIVYGAGALGTRVDPYAEDATAIYLSVDGDGDGIRELLSEQPRVDILAGPPARLVVTLPTTAAPGESVDLTLAILDVRGNAGATVAGALSFIDPPPGLEVPERVTLTAKHAGRITIPIVARELGVHRLSLMGQGSLEGLVGLSNPILVEADPARVLWADLHGHSQLSDGTGTPDSYFAYAREVAALDVAVLTDHDHWGMRALDSHADMWDEIRAAVKRHHEPGRFVTLLGYEWTSWLQGHRHVLYFEDEGEVYSSVDPRFDDPLELWAALRGQPALTFAHHSAGGPISTNWSFPPDPVLEPLTEIVSVHGSSEAIDAPGLIYNPVPGNFVRDALSAGYRFGFVGSGDGHDGHPGLSQIAAPSATGGLAAILSAERTREGILQAMRGRRVYATNGVRIFLRVELDGVPMGSLIAAPTLSDRTTQELVIDVVATSPLERVDLVRSGHVVRLPGDERLRFEHTREIPRLMPGEYHYVRAVQLDGGAAWSSPIYVDSEPASTD